MIPTGLACAIPEGWEGQIRCRSSLGKKGMILPNGVGTIDSDYRGELKVLATWIGDGDSFTVGKGERVAQMLFAPVPLVHVEEVTHWMSWNRLSVERAVWLVWTILRNEHAIH